MSVMPVVTLWFDESGHTGEDLLNADQPVFVLASTNLSHDAAAQLIQAHFPGVKAAELKHGALASRERGQKQIVAFLSDPTTRTSFAVDIWHKEFALFTTLIDFGWRRQCVASKSAFKGPQKRPYASRVRVRIIV